MDNLANYFVNLFVTSLLMTFINILIVAIWKSRQAFRSYGRGNMPLQAVKLPISHNNVVGENTVLQLNIVVQNSSLTRLRLVGDEFWTTRVRTPVSKMSWWRTYNSNPVMTWCGSDMTSYNTDNIMFLFLIYTAHIKFSIKYLMSDRPIYIT